MARYMPFVIGALVAVCTACLFGCFSVGGVPGCSVPTSAGARQVSVAGMKEGLLAFSRRLGEMVPQRISGNSVVRRCVMEIPFDGGDYVTKLGMLLCADAACGLAGAIVSFSLWGFAAGLVAFWGVLGLRSSRRMRSEERRIEAEMPEAFAALAIALGSGHSLAQGMRFVGSHAQEPVKSEFMRVSHAIDCGVPAASALDVLLERLPAPGLGFVSLALKISQRTGAPLRDLLADAAEMVGERMELARRLDVKTSQARMSARLVALMPVAMVGLLTLLSGDFRAGLATPVGAGSVAVALALNLLAWWIIRRMMEVDV